jgi:hypothetical protein
MNVNLEIQQSKLAKNNEELIITSYISNDPVRHRQTDNCKYISQQEQSSRNNSKFVHFKVLQFQPMINNYRNHLVTLNILVIS